MMEAVLIKEQFVGITMDPNREKVDKRDKDGIKRQEFDQEFFTMGMYVSKLLPYANRNFKMGAPAIVKLLKSQVFYKEDLPPLGKDADPELNYQDRESSKQVPKELIQT